MLASGNVRFTADVDVSGRAHQEADRRRPASRVDYDAWIVLITRDELEATVARFPFDAHDDARQPYVVFCSEMAVRDALVDAAASSIRRRIRQPGSCSSTGARRRGAPRHALRKAPRTRRVQADDHDAKPAHARQDPALRIGGVA
jgi:hypothetical protein